MPNPFDGNPRNQPENISRAHASSLIQVAEKFGGGAPTPKVGQ
jgi:hypothetical protein